MTSEKETSKKLYTLSECVLLEQDADYYEVARERLMATQLG